jgi:hypothetical protein
MADELANMQESFKGLPMKDLIGGPLVAACDAQVTLAQAAADFIDSVGMTTDADGNKAARTVEFSMNRPNIQEDGTVIQEKVEIQAPLLAIVNTPALSVKNVTIDFEMEVKSSFSEKKSTDTSASVKASGSYGWGFAKAKVEVSGSVSSHKESTRKSDNRAKYTVHVEARDDGPPEGLSRLLDIMASAVAPKGKSTDTGTPAPTPSPKKK